MLVRTFCVLVLSTLPALAQTGVTRSGGDCDCVTAQGRAVAQGEMTCLTINGRTIMARCDMSQNSPIFRYTDEACVTG
ncbi:hypothetical protein [Jannaschia sp. LMIT008]|uniref:hypothetical protein n=1 Tax=Jannaschia maritima TaxID=3032585 RepID=UPI002811CEC7|nr:hypothetical protein [Jannaschia sp. LMIT008]